MKARICHSGSRGAIPLDDALPIAKQIAEALEAAHEQGIIHRDLKPANIKVRADGTVKVLDLSPAGRPSTSDAGQTVLKGGTMAEIGSDPGPLSRGGAGRLPRSDRSC